MLSILIVKYLKSDLIFNLILILTFFSSYLGEDDQLWKKKKEITQKQTWELLTTALPCCPARIIYWWSFCFIHLFLRKIHFSKCNHVNNPLLLRVKDYFCHFWTVILVIFFSVYFLVFYNFATLSFQTYENDFVTILQHRNQKIFTFTAPLTQKIKSGIFK